MSKTREYRTINENYLKAYMGESFEKVNKRFLLIAAIFGPLYLLYKKIYTICFISFFLIVTAFCINKNISLIIIILIHIIIGLKINKIYVVHSLRKIEEILMQNKNQPEEKIIEICKEKGKPLPIILIIAGIAIVLMICFITITEYKKNNNDTEKKEIKDKIQNLSYVLPSNYSLNTYQKNYHRYLYIDKENNCEITLYYEKYTNNYLDIKDYIMKNTYLGKDDVLQEIKEITINNQTFQSTKILSDNYNRKLLFTIYDNNIYTIEYSKNNIYNNDLCEKELNNFIKLLKFNEE